MKKVILKTKKYFSKIIFSMTYIVITFAIILSCFALYIKINPLDISFAIKYLKENNVLKEDTTIDKLHLEFRKSFILTAQNINVKNDKIDITLKEAEIEVARASIIKGFLSFKKINVNSANITLNLDEYNIGNSEKKADISDIDFKKIIKDSKYLRVIYLSKYININESTVNLIYNNEVQSFKKINLAFHKTKNTLNLIAKGNYRLENNISPISIDMEISDDTSDVMLNIDLANLKSHDVINTFLKNEYFNVNSTLNLELKALLEGGSKLSNISGVVNINDGFVEINNLYDNKLPFNTLKANLEINPTKKEIIFDNSTLVDKNNNSFNINGNFAYLTEPTLNIKVATVKIDLLQGLAYIPSLQFKEWLDQNITKGDAENVYFAFYGPLRKTIDGENGNPYFDIQADFKNASLTYLEDIPSIDNAVGHFSLLKKDININVNSATHSKQKVSSASVDISPILDKQTYPFIKIKAESSGPIHDVLNVLNNKLKLNKEEFFSHYTGSQSAKSSIILNLNKLEEFNNSKSNENDFIIVKTDLDIDEITGIDPVFEQEFKATDSKVTITDDIFKLEASGFMNNSSFTLDLEEQLMNFGEFTKLNVTSSFDSFLLKDYLQIPSFNLSGLVNSTLSLNRNKDVFNYDIKADLENNLLSFGLLDYTKPFMKPAKLTANGVFDQQNNILTIANSNLESDDLNIKGNAKIFIDNIDNSEVDLKNIKVGDKTFVDEFSINNHNLKLVGNSLNIRPLILKSEGSSAKESKVDLKTIDITLDKVYLNNDEGLLNLKANLDLQTNLSGFIQFKDSPNAQNFRAKFISENKDTVKVETLIPNFGLTLSKLGINSNLASGLGILFGDLIFKDNKFEKADLTLNIKSFQVVKAPLMAKVLAQISLDQLLTDKKGILFNDLYTNLTLEDNILSMANGKARGPSLGVLFNNKYDLQTKAIDLKGTLVPIVKLNSVLSNIPFVGYILTGSQGAISGTDFRIYTKNGEDIVRVSPLSTITPGIIKDLFETVSGSDNEDSKVIKKARKKALKDQESKEKENN